MDNNVASSWCTQSANSKLTPKEPNVFDDTDSDGVVDCLDVCPTLDDALIGTSCDDGDPCTTGEQYDANCICSGGIFQDQDNDGVCDANDLCPNQNDLLDANNNGIPDGCETLCPDYVYETSGISIDQDTSASIAVITNGRIVTGNIIEYHAGVEVEMKAGFEVESGATFHAFIAPCD